MRSGLLPISVILIFCIPPAAAAQGISFTSAATPTGAPVFAMRAADLNHDGATDLLLQSGTTSSQKGYLVIASGAPGGQFIISSSGMTGTGGFSADSPFGVMDLDHDGNLDLVASDSISFPGVGLFWRLGDGAGSYNSPGNINIQCTGAGLSGLSYADFDGDGFADAAIANYLKTGSITKGYVSIARGNPAAAGFINIPMAESMTGLLSSVRVVDLNLDGSLDYVGGLVAQCGYCAPGSSPSVLAVGLNNGSSTAFGVTFITAHGDGTPAIATGDFNQNGISDLVLCNPSAARIELLTNNYPAPGFLSTFYNSSGTDGLNCLAAADLNSDGRVDIAAGATAAGIVIFPGNGSGFASSLSVASAGAASAITAADFDGNGRIDLAITEGQFVELLSQVAAPVPGVSVSGIGTPGCVGATRLSLLAPVSASVSTATFFCSNVPAASLGVLLIGDVYNSAGSDYLNLGVVLHIDPFLSSYLAGISILSDSTNAASITIPATGLAPLIGTTHVAQALWVSEPWFACSGAYMGLHSSNGLLITIQP